MDTYSATVQRKLNSAVAGNHPSSAFDRIRGRCDKIVLYGAGNVGKKLALSLTKDFSPENIFFADADKSIQGLSIDGIKVLSPEDAAKRYGENALFVVTVFNRESYSDDRDISKKLSGLGARRVIPFALAAWKYGGDLLPHFAQGSPRSIIPYGSQILEAASFFQDSRSQEVFLELLDVSLTAPYEQFSDTDDETQYFFPEFIKTLPQSCVVADCGAYDGDSIRSFLDEFGADRIKHWHAFEPDPVNYRRLLDFTSTLPHDLQKRIACYNAAVSVSDGHIGFTSGDLESSRVDHESDSLIQSVSLDSVFSSERLDWIKLDIEGFEKDALLGGAKCIARDRPGMAISVYHLPDDFFALPLLVHKLLHAKESKMFLRRYASYFFESVLYVPCSERA